VRAVVAVGVITAAAARAVAATPTVIMVATAEMLLDLAAAVEADPRSLRPALRMLASKQARAATQTD
jgi:hypothetical protein